MGPLTYLCAPRVRYTVGTRYGLLKPNDGGGGEGWTDKMVIFARFEIVSSIGVGAVLWSLAEGCRADPSCLLPHIALTAEQLVYLPPH